MSGYAAPRRPSRAVIDYGLRAKHEVLDQDCARRTAEDAGIELEGLTGARGGIIGALAAVHRRLGARGAGRRASHLAGRKVHR